jgi:hypothetical protein
MTDEIAARVARDAGVDDLVDILSERVDGPDLASLLLAVFRRRAARRTPSQVLERYQSDPFVRPSSLAPAALDAIVAAAVAALPPGFERLELSPVCPLGTSSVLGGISQDRVVATARGTEVVSDPTNVLALECAVRRRGDRTTTVRLAAAHRALRATPTEEPFTPHFGLFTLCTAARAGDEDSMLAEHVTFYARLLGDTSHDIDRSPRKQAYYSGATFGVSVDGVEIAEGGFVDWTSTLLGDAKERLLISGVGLDMLARLGGRTTARNR